ncbi:MAG: MATE family efflux transporter [Pseudomonadota bacterium]
MSFTEERKTTQSTPGARQTFDLAWPMTIKAIFLHGTIVIDGWLVSSLGEMSLAAMGLAAAIGGMALGVIFAFSHAMQIRTAQASGSGDPLDLKSTLTAGLALSLTIGAVGVFALLTLGAMVIVAMAPSAEVADHAHAYLSVFTLVVLFESAGQCLSSYFNGRGRTRIPLYGYLLSVPINIGASVVLIHGFYGVPAFGVVGAAMGSALGAGVQVGFFALRLWQSDRHLAGIKGWRHHTAYRTVQRHLIFALPIAATFISATFSTHICTLIYARMALNDFAALTLIAPWNMVAGQIAMQWTQATGIIVAQLLGQRASERTLDRFLSTAWRGAFVAAAVVSMVFVALSLSIDMLYADLTAQTRATLVGFLPILLLSTFPRATNAICGNTLRASGDTIYVMNLFLCSQWLFRVPATAFAVLFLGLPAFWVLAIMLLEELLKFWPFHSRIWKGNWKRASVNA